MTEKKKIFFGLVAAGAAAAIAGVAVLFSGIVDIGARAPHMAITRVVLHTAFGRSVAYHSSDLTVPDDLDSEGRVALGAQVFEQVCSNCHGRPGMGQNPIALSMRPSPQYLPAVVDKYDDAELAWIVQNGVRLSAMPAWPAEGRSDETWSVVAFLKQLPDMTAEEFQDLTQHAVPETEPMPLGTDFPVVETEMPRKSAPADEYAWKAPASGFGGIRNSDMPLARCVACHGPDGRGEVTGGEAPNLTIQTPDYIHASLQAYSTGERHSGFMQPQAIALSDDQMQALSTYFTRTPRASGSAVSASNDVLSRGREIATAGIPDRHVVACLSCHERDADEPENGLYFPSLFGQSEVYLNRQMAAFAAGNRGVTGVFNPMNAEAHGLTSEETAAVSAWLAAQVPTAQVNAMPVSASAEDVAQAQDMIERNCASCHGRDLAGMSEHEAPNLTLQTAPYVFERLHFLRDFDSHVQQNPELVGENAMAAKAQPLTDDDIAGMASYIGSLDPVAEPQTLDQEAIARGETLAMNGDAARELPACITCHSADTVEDLPLFARLNGQSVDYLQRRLMDLGSEIEPTGPTINPMYAIAAQLTDEEKSDLATYFASLAPIPK